MDMNKLKVKEVRAMDTKKLLDSAKSIRKELVGLRMDVYNAGPQAKSQARNLRKTLARMLTVCGEKTSKSKK